VFSFEVGHFVFFLVAKNKRKQIPPSNCLIPAKNKGWIPWIPIFDVTHVVPQMIEVRKSAKYALLLPSEDILWDTGMSL